MRAGGTFFLALGLCFTIKVYGVTTCTSGLLSAEEVNATDQQNVLPVPSLNLDFQDWIFPTETFTCNGNITRLVFQLESIGNPEDATLMDSPEIQIWRGNLDTSLETDYVKASTIRNLQDGTNMFGNVFEYVLPIPIPVREGDILGYGVPSELRLKYYLHVMQLNENASRDDTLSFRRRGVETGQVFDIGSSALNPSMIFPERNFIPLVAADIVPTFAPEIMPGPTDATLTLPTPSINVLQLAAIVAGTVTAAILFILLHVLGVILLACYLRRRSGHYRGKSSMKNTFQQRSSKHTTRRTNKVTGKTVIPTNAANVSSEIINTQYTLADAHEPDGNNHTNVYETLTREGTFPSDTLNDSSNLDNGYVALTSQAQTEHIDDYSYINDPSNDPDVRIPVGPNLAYISLSDLQAAAENSTDLDEPR